MVSLKNFTASSMSAEVLRETLRVERCRKRSQLVLWLLKRGDVSEGSACGVRVINTGV
jgi:hypothetical protein